MRYRITFRKESVIIFTSALDLLQIWERSLRRAHLLVKYSEGFHPMPKIQLAAPLPVGFKGKNELIDIWFTEDYSENEVLECLNGSLPIGLEIKGIEEIPENQKAVNGRLESAEYIVTIKDSRISYPFLQQSIKQLMEKDVIQRQKNKKDYDLRPLILSINANISIDNLLQMELLLKASSGASGRPDEILLELGIEPVICEIERIKINFRD